MDYCILCSRSFASKGALEQHERDSPVHNNKVHCQTSDCFFGTEEALEQHQQYAPVHNKSFHFHDCSWPFSSNKTLKNHRRSCEAASGRPLEPADTPFYQGPDEGVSSNIWPRSPIVDPRSFLLEHFAQMFISAIPPAITTNSLIARKDVPKPTQETGEFFMFPALHPNVTDAVFPEIPSTWFNDDDDDNFDREWFTHVMGRFICQNHTCIKRFWDSWKVSIEIRGYNDNGYSAIVYNQRCKCCNWLGTFELDEQSYIERVAYRLKK